MRKCQIYCRKRCEPTAGGQENVKFAVEKSGSLRQGMKKLQIRRRKRGESTAENEKVVKFPVKKKEIYGGE